MQPTLFQCPNCAAPLQPVVGSAWLKCAYCGGTLQLAQPFGADAPSTPSGGAAPSALPPLYGCPALLARFEAHVRWEAVSPEWRARRGPWLDALAAARSVAEGAALLESLELNLGWSAVLPAWPERRADWVAQVRAATTQAEFATALMYLEANTTWEAVVPAWADVRAAWSAELLTFANAR
jgi:hypothetical protein